MRPNGRSRSALYGGDGCGYGAHVEEQPVRTRQGSSRCCRDLPEREVGHEEDRQSSGHEVRPGSRSTASSPRQQQAERHGHEGGAGVLPGRQAYQASPLWSSPVLVTDPPVISVLKDYGAGKAALAQREALNVENVVNHFALDLS